MSVDMKKKAEEQQRVSPWVILAVTVVGILIIGDLNGRMANARRLEREAEVLSTEVAALATEQVGLSEQVAGATSEAHIAKWAHADAKLVRDGEVLVVPVAPGGVTRSTAGDPVETRELPSNFQVWWALIFGG